MSEGLPVDTNDIARLIYLSLILLSVGGWLIVSFRNDLSKTLQRAFIWFLIFFGLFGAYGIWTDISGNFELDAHYDEARNDIFKIEKSIDGHYYSNVKINGATVRMLVDTGATKTLLSLTDAKKLNLQLSDLKFVNPVQTANGVSYSASYMVDKFEWFGRKFDTMEIQIMKENLFSSLLGMDVINSARALVIKDDSLSIRF